MIHDFLIAGDFGGREHTGRAPSEALSRRRTWSVDRDDLDDAIARAAPEVRIAFGEGTAPVVLQFTTLDDFHPDQLAQRVPLLRELRELRSRLAAPVRMPSAPRDSDSVSTARTGDIAASIGGGSLLDQILGDAPGGTSAPSPSESRPRPVDELSEFVRRAVAPHVVGDTGPAQREQIARVDDAIAAALRVILHHPAYQALESLWRGVDLVARRVETGESLHITLVDVTKSELVAAIADASDASAGGLRTLLETPSRSGDGSRWSVLIAAHTFGGSDLASLGRLARVARDAGVPCIAAAAPELAGATSFGDGSDVDDWSASPIDGWDALRTSEDARWLSLALPRFLVRVPYGANGEPCEVVPFEEIDRDGPAHESFLWANAALLCAIVLGWSAAADEPWATQGTVGNLPFYVTRSQGEPTAVPCAETLLTQRSVVHLLDRGLTAIATARDGDEVRVPRLQSIAAPPAPLAIRTTA